MDNNVHVSSTIHQTCASFIFVFSTTNGDDEDNDSKNSIHLFEVGGNIGKYLVFCYILVDT